MRLILVLFFTSLTCFSAKIPQSDLIHRFTLDNGLKIIVKEDHRAPVVVSMIWYNVGSADEPGGITGVSHALEHIMFKGTKRYPAGMFSKTIAGLGGEENAFTDYDYTAYFEQLSSDRLEKALVLEADRMNNLLIDPQEFSKEIQVVQEERLLRTDNNPRALTLERFMATSQLTSPYQHPIIGWMSDLKEMRAQDLKAWYHNFYVPNNAVLVVVGDVNPELVQKLATQYFGAIPRGAAYIRKKQTEPPSMGPKKIEIHAKAKVPVLVLGYTTPSTVSAPNQAEPYALEVIAALLGAPDSGRLTKTLVRDHHIATAVQTDYNLYTRYQNQFLFYAMPAEGVSMEKLKQNIMGQIHHLQEHPVSDEELSRTKTMLIAQKTFEKDSLFGQAALLGLLETIGLHPDNLQTYIPHIQGLTSEQIQSTAKRYFQENSLTEAQLVPDI